MGKFSRTWQLVKQSFVILRSDKQLMLFPILSAISCLIVTAIIATGGTLLMMPSITTAAANGERFQPNHSPMVAPVVRCSSSKGVRSVALLAAVSIAMLLV